MKKLLILLVWAGWLAACDDDRDGCEKVLFTSPTYIEYPVEEGGHFTITTQSPAYIYLLGTMTNDPSWTSGSPVLMGHGIVPDYIGNAELSAVPFEFQSNWYTIKNPNGFVLEVETLPCNERKELCVYLVAMLSGEMEYFTILGVLGEDGEGEE